MIEFSVQDSGVGIPREGIPHLFQAFVQVDNSITRKFRGNGLGLVLSRKLVKALGGDLILAESSCNRGSTFILQVPTLHSFFFSSIGKKYPQLNLLYASELFCSFKNWQTKCISEEFYQGDHTCLFMQKASKAQKSQF